MDSYPFRRYTKVYGNFSYKERNKLFILKKMEENKISELAVPEKIWRLYEDEKDSHGDQLDMDKSDKEVWWDQKMLTNLDLSSNMLTCISSDLQNLLDLTVLNVIDKISLKSEYEFLNFFFVLAS